MSSPLSFRFVILTVHVRYTSCAPLYVRSLHFARLVTFGDLLFPLAPAASGRNTRGPCSPSPQIPPPLFCSVTFSGAYFPTSLSTLVSVYLLRHKAAFLSCYSSPSQPLLRTNGHEPASLLHARPPFATNRRSPIFFAQEERSQQKPAIIDDSLGYPMKL